MIIYRPIAPLTAGRTGLKSALAAMALTAVLGTTWQLSGETPGTQEGCGNTGKLNGHPVESPLDRRYSPIYR
ncbi:hypothetical protein [Arthrobacter sp. NicSoilB8]|uniref:hypothetical protein n=1 Tax=Arthrobacter sp. NicSoilB8 TaxID=2830998 RepID=UPI001CC3B669|nr:hypothetical protein [Arthrobacter sp. NicSoilB8]BCW69043.1 hypothetical protein NicSoilB8_00870 [Arthrobacter sp. NicSoilB8]